MVSPWGLLCVFGGYAAGDSSAQVASWIGTGGAASPALAVVVAVLASRVRKHHAAEGEAERDREARPTAPLWAGVVDASAPS